MVSQDCIGAVTTIEQHMRQAIQLLEQARLNHDDAKIRHYETEIKNLKTYQAHHPDEDHDPTSLEVFCDMNPDAPQCRVFED